MRYLVGDTETAGLDGPNETSSGVAEVAGLYFSPQLEVLHTWSSMVNPGRPMSEGAIKVNGITDDMVKDAPMLDHVMAQYVWDEPICFVAHNSSFDLKFWGPHIENLHHTLCTLALARQYIRGVPNYKLGTLADELELVKGEAHRAAGDVTTTFNLLCFIIKESGRSLEDLCKLSLKPRVLPCMPFGKHAGRPWLQVPTGYLGWLLEQDIPTDIRYSAEQAMKGRL